MVTFHDLRTANPAMFHESAASWKDWADAALKHAGYLNDDVGRHIAAPHWTGLTAELARGKVTAAHTDLSASAARLSQVETLLVQAGIDVENAQQDLLGTLSEATGLGYSYDDGTGKIQMPDTKGWKPEDVKRYQDYLPSLQRRADAAVYRATRDDQGVANALDAIDPGRDPGDPGGPGGPGGGHQGGSSAGWNGDYGSSGGPPGGAIHPASGQVKTWINEALGILRQSGFDISTINPDDIATIIQFESGGNPNSINLWDSNAAAGHPSKGLMQTIDPTFNSYALRGHTNVWNPVDNIIAGVRYAVHRYGSIANVPGIRNLHHGAGYVGY